MALKFAYADSTKEELLREFDARRQDGRDIQVTGSGTNGGILKDDLVKALEADDKAAEGAANEVAPAPSASRPGLASEDYKPNANGWDPDDRNLYGLTPYKKLLTPDPNDPRRTLPLQGDGEVYYLRVVEDDPRGATHHLKNEIHTWKGSEAQFKDSFEESDE